ncbi:hypothetical protein G9H60_02645 [Aquirufa sp. 15D-MOB]|nr:hypothetical protein [Aquirufa aurantiipilula]
MKWLKSIIIGLIQAILLMISLFLLVRLIL